MPSYVFEIYVDKAGFHRWRLKAANEQIIATGPAYRSRAGCRDAVEAVKKYAPKALVLDV